MPQSFRPFSSLKRASFAASAAAVIAALGFAAAPAQAEFETGDWELQLSGFAQNGVDFDGFAANASVQAGYFFNDQTSFGVRQTLQYTDVGFPGSAVGGSTALYLNWHFGGRNEALQPYIGGNLGFIYGDFVAQDTFFAGPEIGLKWFFDESWFFFGAIEYQWLFRDADEATEQFDDGVFNYRIGIGVIIEPQN